MYASKIKDTSSGNVLFLVLVGVILFAALSYAISSSSRNSGKMDVSQDKAKLMAAQILQYASAVRQAVLTMRTIGCLDTQISFEAEPADGYLNASSPSDYSCHVFRKEGGGVARQQPPTGSSSTPTYYYTRNYLWDYGIPSAQHLRDMVFELGGINKTVCEEINRQIGVAYAPVPEEGDNMQFGFKWVGSFGSTSTVVNNLPGNIGCLKTTRISQPPGSSTYVALTDYYALIFPLIERTGSAP